MIAHHMRKKPCRILREIDENGQSADQAACRQREHHPHEALRERFERGRKKAASATVGMKATALSLKTTATERQKPPTGSAAVSTCGLADAKDEQAKPEK